MYERRGGRETERWFATLLGHEDLEVILQSNPFDLPDNAVDVRLLPDIELGVTAVRIVCDEPFATSVDEVASWALAACMVAELVADVQSVAQEIHPNPINTRNEQ